MVFTKVLWTILEVLYQKAGLKNIREPKKLEIFFVATFTLKNDNLIASQPF